MTFSSESYGSTEVLSSGDRIVHAYSQRVVAQGAVAIAEHSVSTRLTQGWSVDLNVVYCCDVQKVSNRPCFRFRRIVDVLAGEGGQSQIVIMENVSNWNDDA